MKDFGCYSFLYSGCGGNKNNFGSKQKCLHECGAEISSRGLLKSPVWMFLNHTYGACLYGNCDCDCQYKGVGFFPPKGGCHNVTSLAELQKEEFAGVFIG